MSRIAVARFEVGDYIDDETTTVLSVWQREGGGLGAIILVRDAPDGVLKHHHDCDEHGCHSLRTVMEKQT